MATTYIRYPNTGSGSVPTYANQAALPASANDGALAVTLDTDTLWAFNFGSLTWKAIGSPSTISSIGALDGQAASANGASVSAGALFMQSASGTMPGLVNTTTQTLAGNKTFSGTIAASNLSGTNTGDISLTAVGSAPSANGASLSGQALTLQPADGTHPGLVSIVAQTIAGVKTFSNGITMGAALNMNGQTITNTGTLTLPTATDTLVARTTTDTLTNKTLAAGSNTITGLTNANLSGSAAITNANLATMVNNTVKGNTSGSTGTPSDLALGDLTVPGILSVTGGTKAVIGAGAAISLATQTANTIFAGPTSGGALAPTFRSSVYADLSPGLKTPTVQTLQLTGTTTGWLFTISTSTTCAAGDTYTNNGNTYTVLGALTAQTGQVLFTSGVSAPTASGTLTRATGAGTASITFTASTALATYTRPSSPAPLYLRVRLVGAGGGGAGSGSSGLGTGGTGGNTVFGTLLLAANGGGGGIGAATLTGGAGGTTSIGAGPIVISSLTGGAGGGAYGATGNFLPGGMGASSPFGGAGNGGSNTSAAGAAVANSGSGGGGAGGNSSAQFSGPGGGAGGFVDVIITSPASTYVYAIGVGGTAGSLGVAGLAGGVGGSGSIIVEEYNQ